MNSRIGSPWPRPPGSLRGIERVEAAVGGEDQHFDVVSAGNANFSASSALKAMPERSVDVAAQRADPALLGDDDRDRLALDQRLLDRGLVVLGRLGKVGAAFAERRLRAELLAHLLDLAGDRLPLLLLGAEQRLELLALVAQLLVLLADLHLLELAQIAQPHVEDGVGLHVGELEGLHQDGLRLVLVADDLDDLVEVEIGDQIAAEHFEPMLDLRQAVVRAPQQHLAPVGEPFAQAPRRGRRPSGCGPSPARSC